MREIKFRAWKMHNGKLRRWVCSPFGLLNYAQRHPEAPVLHYQDVNDIRDFMPDADVIEQYTGLKDNNGKEIYEGDIIQKYAGGTIGVIYWNAEELQWYVDEKLPDCPDGVLLYPLAYIGDEKIAIGNIHENLELLEKE